MTASVSNNVFTNQNLSLLIFSNLNMRDLDQSKATCRSFNKDGTEVQKRQLPGLFPKEFSQIVRDAAFQNFHRPALTPEYMNSVGEPPARADQLSSPIVAGYVDGVAFLACKVADWTDGRLFRRVTIGMYPQVKDVLGATVLFGIHLYGGQTEDLVALLKTGKMVSYFSVDKARPCCCVRLCDWVAKKICNKEIERDRFEYPQLRIEGFKPRSGEKEKKE